MAGELHASRNETQRLHEFLMGLYNDYYGRLRSQILSTDPLPSLDRAYHLVVQEERIRTSKSAIDDKPAEAVLGFAVRTASGRGRGSSERPTCAHCHKVGHDVLKCYSLLACSHCKKHGHEVANCYELVGYPEGWEPKGSGRCSRPPVSASSMGRGRGTVKANATVAAGPLSSSPTSNLFSPDSGRPLRACLVLLRFLRIV